MSDDGLGGYAIISADNIEDLEQSGDDFVREMGYRPIGGLSIHRDYDSFSDSEWIFYQVMYKEPEENKDAKRNETTADVR